jgi:hypothetical protein
VNAEDYKTFIGVVSVLVKLQVASDIDYVRAVVVVYKERWDRIMNDN